MAASEVSRSQATPSAGSNRTLVVCSAVFLVAVGARLGYLLVGEYLPLSKQSYDSMPFWGLAGGLLYDGSLSENGVPTTEFEPLYPLFIAAGRRLTSDRVIWVQALQAVASSIGAIALYRLSLALTARRGIAVVSALLYAINPLLVRNGVRASEQWLLSIFLIAFASAFIAAQNKTRHHTSAALAGFWLGLATLTRASALPLVIVATIALLRERRRRAALALALVAIVTCSPMAIRNYTVNGSLMPSRGGLSLYLGNSRYAGFLMPTDELDLLIPHVDALLASRRPELLAGGVDLEDDLDAFLTREAWAEMKRDPWTVLVLKARYVAYFFWPRVVPARGMTDTTTAVFRGDRYVVENSVARPLSEEIVYATFFSVIFLAFLRGLYLRRHALHRDVVLWCILLSTLLVYVVYFPATKYRTPVEFVLLFYAAVAIDDAVTRRHSGRSGRLTSC